MILVPCGDPAVLGIEPYYSQGAAEVSGQVNVAADRCTIIMMVDKCLW